MPLVKIMLQYTTLMKALRLSGSELRPHMEIKVDPAQVNHRLHIRSNFALL